MAATPTIPDRSRGRGVYQFGKNKKKKIFGQDPQDIIDRANAIFGGGLESLQDVIDAQRVNPELADLLQGKKGMKNPTTPEDVARGGKLPERKEAPQVTFRPKPKVEQPSMLDQLFQQLVQSVGAGTADIDYETALRDSEKAIREAYANDIKAVRSGNRAARRDTARGRKELEGLYDALSKRYQQEENQAGRQGERLANNIQGRSERSADYLTELAAKLGQEQAATAQGLGIEDALKDLIPENTQDATGRAANILQEGAQDANLAKQLTGNQTRFLQRGGINAELEGANRSAGLMADLQNFLQDSQNQIASLRGQRGREIAANKQQTMSSVNEMQAQADADMWDRLMGLAGLKLDMEDTNNDNAFQRWKAEQDILSRQAQQQSATESFVPEYMQQYSQALNAMPKNVRGVMERVIRSDPFKYGQVERNGEYLKANPTALANIAEEQAVAEGVTSPEELAMIRLAAMIYAQGGV